MDAFETPQAPQDFMEARSDSCRECICCPESLLGEIITRVVVVAVIGAAGCKQEEVDAVVAGLSSSSASSNACMMLNISEAFEKISELHGTRAKVERTPSLLKAERASDRPFGSFLTAHARNLSAVIASIAVVASVDRRNL